MQTLRAQEAVADAERETTRDSLDAHDAPASPAPEAADSATLLYAAEQSVSEPLLTLQVPEDSDRPISDTPPPTGGALTGSGARLQPLGYSSPPPQRGEPARASPLSLKRFRRGLARQQSPSNFCPPFWIWSFHQAGSPRMEPSLQSIDRFFHVILS